MNSFPEYFLPSDRGVQKDHAIHIELHLDEAIKGIPFIVVNDTGFDEFDNEDNVSTFYGDSMNGKDYIFSLAPYKKPRYFDLIFKNFSKMKNVNDGYLTANSYLLKAYHFEPGDQIHIYVRQDEERGGYIVEFNGVGAVKYTCRYSYEPQLVLLRDDSIFPEPVERKIKRKRYEHGLAIALEKIAEYAPEMTAYSSQLLYADAISIIGCHIVECFYEQMESKRKAVDDRFIDLFMDYLECKHLSCHDEIARSAKLSSLFYAKYQLKIAMLESFVKCGKTDFDTIYSRILIEENKGVRDRMILALILGRKIFLASEFATILEDALTKVKDKKVLERLKKVEVPREYKPVYIWGKL